MKEVLSSAAKAELGALLHNSKEACPLQIALTKMGHPQNATSLSTDNSTAAGISISTVKQRRSKPLTCATIGYEIALLKKERKVDIALLTSKKSILTVSYIN
jgi:hypothetical protein